MSRTNFLLKYGDDEMQNAAADEFVSSMTQPMAYNDRKIIRHPNFPPEKHHAILDKFPGKVRDSLRETIMEHPDVRPDVIHRIAKEYEQDDYRVLRHQNTSGETLRMLHDSGDYIDVKRPIAAHPNTPPDILSQLIRHPAPSVRFESILNPKTSTEDIQFAAKNDPLETNQWAADDKLKERGVK